MEAAFYIFLADLTAIVHACFVVFVVAGQILILIGWLRGWPWTRGLAFRAVHLAGVGFVMLEAWFGLTCPLTALENRLRLAAGGEAYAASFIGYWVDRLLFYSAPAWVFTLIYTAFALLVTATFLFYPPAFPRAQKPGARDL